MNAEQKTDFETWAKILIRRKVPDDYQHLINREVIKDGEIILRRGGAFEIHITPRNPAGSSTATARDGEILVTPMPHLPRATKVPAERRRF